MAGVSNEFLTGDGSVLGIISDLGAGSVGSGKTGARSPRSGPTRTSDTHGAVAPTSQEKSGLRSRFPVGAALMAMLLAATLTAPAPAQPRGGPGELPTIEEKTAGMQKIDGFFPLHWERSTGKLWMEIARFDSQLLYLGGLAAGLGSNDIGLDRAQLGDSRIVKFERVGPKILMMQPNYRFRAFSDNPAEVRAVEDAFAPSILWGFEIAAESGARTLVDLSEFLIRDTHDIIPRLRPGSYHLEKSRSAVYLPMTRSFPNNTEIEVTLTFTRSPAAAGGARGGGPESAGSGRFFEGVGSVAATPEAATLRVHHSLVQLPDDGYRPRRFDPRAGYGSISYRDYSAPLDESITQRLIRRHRLQKANPTAAVSDPVRPIVYYLDPGTPEPIRSALLEGASWWNQAFEAAGYRNAFRVEMLPEDASPLDIRYNVINWVHRSTRGWSYGASVTDPRTGEILKGVVTLGSLRVRQDYMIAEGLLSPYENGTETPPQLAEWALARIRQLSAHEVGHTLGLSHNYYDSTLGRISVMDYPHPLVKLKEDGSFDSTEVYAEGIGEWDKVTIAYGYQDFPQETDEKDSLTAILGRAWERDLRFMTNQDTSVHPKVDQWSNGSDAAAELQRMMAVRRAALARFGEKAIKLGQPLAALEEVLVPLYLHHRYQVEAAASALGGLYYVYALRGDGREAVRSVPATEQRAALDALLRTLDPAELALPENLLRNLPPRPPGFSHTRELFPRSTGPAFDALSPAAVAADHTISNILQADRSARLVQQHALDASLPGLDDVLGEIVNATFGRRAREGYAAEISRAVERVLADHLMALARNASLAQVRALASLQLEELLDYLLADSPAKTQAYRAHDYLIASDISRFLERPAESYQPPTAQPIPPGAPIGQPALEWLQSPEPGCSWWEWHLQLSGQPHPRSCSRQSPAAPGGSARSLSE